MFLITVFGPPVVYTIYRKFLRTTWLYNSRTHVVFHLLIFHACMFQNKALRLAQSNNANSSNTVVGGIDQCFP